MRDREQFAAKFDQLNLHFLSQQFGLKLRGYHFIKSESRIFNQHRKCYIGLSILDKFEKKTPIFFRIKFFISFWFLLILK
jgi:hypothetical protein